MKQWRVVLVVIALLAVLIMFVSIFLFDQTWWRYPWGSLAAAHSPRYAWRLALAQDAGVRANLAALLAGLVTHFLVGVVVLYLIPRRVRHMAHALAAGWRRWLRFLVIGFLLVVTLAAVGLLSILSIHSMPLPFIMAMFFFLASLGGAVPLTYELGRGLLARAGWAGGSPLVSQALGTLLINAMTSIPFIGGVTLSLVMFIGVGLAIATRFGSGKSWSLIPLMEEPQV